MLAKLTGAATAMLVAGCASMHDPGWRGEGAQPFDAARAQCMEQAMRVEAGAARTAGFEACMAGKGWRRPD